MKNLLTLIIPTFFVLPIEYGFAQPAEQTVNADCTTKQTGANGKRDACDSEWSELNAPSGFVFAEKSLQSIDVSANGSEHGCRVMWDKYVEVIPGSGITQPGQLRVQAHARSPRGAYSGRGFQHCKYVVKLSKYVQ